MKIIHNTLFKKVIFFTIILNLIAMVIELESNLDNRFVVFLENFVLFFFIIFQILRSAPYQALFQLVLRFHDYDDLARNTVMDIHHYTITYIKILRP